MGLAEHQDSIYKKMGEITQKRAEMDELYKKLERSLAVEKLWPGVFDHTPVTARLSGSPLRPHEMTLVISNGKETRDFPLGLVPKVLRNFHLERAARTSNNTELKMSLLRLVKK